MPEDGQNRVTCSGPWMKATAYHAPSRYRPVNRMNRSIARPRIAWPECNASPRHESNATDGGDSDLCGNARPCASAHGRGNQHSMTFTAKPPREVSLYLSCMSRPVSRMVLITLSSDTL